VVHEVVIKADSVAAARAALVAAVRAAGDSAAEAGASRNSGNALAASPDLDAVAASLAASPGPDLVILRSDRNLPRGLPLGLDFEVIPNRVIYRSGQPVRTLSLTVMSGGRYRQADDLRAEIGGLLLELVRDLRGRGVPAENIPPALVPDEEVEDFVDRLRSTDRLEPGTVPASVVPVGVVPRGDVTPAGPLRFYLVTLR